MATSSRLKLWQFQPWILLCLAGVAGVSVNAVSRPSSLGTEPVASNDGKAFFSLPPERFLEIASSVTLTAETISRPIIITKSNITIDGGGVTLAASNAGPDASPKTYREVAIYARGVSNVTLKNFKAKGWETGLKVVDGSGWVIENCDFSDNFHDPEFGWGENGRRGGIVLERVHQSVLRKNKANRVWDGCVLVDSDENTLEENDFSHTSNTCLKLWHASKNIVRKNRLTHGIRISPGEVHARDSTCVLIESGSNENHFVENDCTHGGDGIFVRVLNGWCSVGNVFERNDCSFANNNGFECWARDNIFRANKANYCSYGFWLGGSDHTRLEDNEASYNGLPDGQHNSPHLPDKGHAGIVFMYGPSSHTVAKRNKCIGNNGAGIAAIGDLESRGQKWKAHHWIIEDNLLSRNRWGIFLKYADWVDARANRFDDLQTGGNSNSIESIHIDAGVTRLMIDPAPLLGTGPGMAESRRPSFQLDGPSSEQTERSVSFAVGGLSKLDPTLKYTWDLGDGSAGDTPEVHHTFRKAGFYRVGVTVTTAAGSELGWRDFYAVDDAIELGTEGQADAWGIEDFHDRKRSNEQSSRAQFTDDQTEFLVGRSSLRAIISPYAGFRAALTYPKTQDADWPLKGKTKLTFWLKVINEDATGWQGGPFVVLHGDGDQRCYLEPRAGKDLMRELDQNEGRDGWRRMVIPLLSDDRWQVDGSMPERARALSLGFDSWGAPTLRIWIDGLSFE